MAHKERIKIATSYVYYQQPDYFLCPANILTRVNNIKVITQKNKTGTNNFTTYNSLAFKCYEQLFREVLKTTYEFVNNTGPCVYLIGRFYIGKTKDLNKRLKTHFRDCINGRHTNTFFNNIVIECLLSNNPLPLKILSYNMDDEVEMIDHYSKEFGTLTNIVSNFN